MPFLPVIGSRAVWKHDDRGGEDDDEGAGHGAVGDGPADQPIEVVEPIAQDRDGRRCRDERSDQDRQTRTRGWAAA